MGKERKKSCSSVEMDYKIILERPEVKFVPEKFNRGS